MKKEIPTELEAKIDEINKWLFYGDQKDVAKRAGIYESDVSAFLKKKRTPSKKFLDAAIEVMNKNKARFECATA